MLKLRSTISTTSKLRKAAEDVLMEKSKLPDKEIEPWA